jgi:hypothetical protein
VRRLDEIYQRALGAGLLRPDPSLIVQEPEIIAEIEEGEEEAPAGEGLTASTTPTPSVASSATSFSVQVDTPDAGAVGRAELSVSRIGGVTSALTTSLAVGGTSVMRVTYTGDPSAFRAALEAQGWRVEGSGTSLRISRGGGD